MTFSTKRARISGGCEQVLALRREEIDRQEERARRAERLGEVAPIADPPRADSAEWVGWASRILSRYNVPKWMRDADVIASHGEDMVGPLLERLIGWPEFHELEGWRIELRWTRGSIVRKDFVSTEVVAARPKVISPADREAWLGGEDAPQFRLELSLPWWLLADEDQRERGLHVALAYLGVADHQPVLRQPDISGHAATFGRYGVSGPREVSAVFHAQRHPSHEIVLRELGFDPITGHGQIWEAGGPPQEGVLELARHTRQARQAAPESEA